MTATSSRVIVVSDTSPIRYLIMINAVDILSHLYSTIYVPPEVVAELSASSAPQSVRQWLAAPPTWLKVVAPQAPDATLRLHAGEAAAISLALELRADRILIDDRDGRRLAESRGLRVIGTLGVLDSAAARGHLDPRAALQQLEGAGFRIGATLRREFLQRDEARRKSRGSK